MAAAYGHPEMTAALLAAGAGVNRRDHRGETPLHLPAFFQHLECLALLLQAGAEAGARDGDGNTALHVAAGMNRDRAARLLLEAGAEVEARNREGLTPLDQAIVNVHFNISLHHIEEGIAKHHEHNSEAAQVLLEAGAAIDPRRLPVGDRHQLWPHLTPAGMLYDNGDLDYPKLPGLPTDLQRDIADLPSNRGPGRRPISPAAVHPSLLHDAALKGMAAPVRTLLDSGAAPDTAVRNSGTPLHLAASEGHLEVAGLLLERGADPEMSISNTADRRWGIDRQAPVTPLTTAVRRGQVEMVRLLVEWGALHPKSIDGSVYSCPEDHREELTQFYRELGLVT